MLNSATIWNWLFSVISCWVIASCMYFSIVLVTHQNDGIKVPDRVYNYDVIVNGVTIHLANNYFISKDQYTTGKFLVQNEKCRIPQVDPWNAMVMPLITQFPSYNCSSKVLNVTYVSNFTILVNEDVLQTNGVNWNNISCCYKTVFRVEQDMTKYDKNADNAYQYSKDCYIMNKTTQPQCQFIKVTCEGNTTKGEPFLYKNFHMIPIFSKDGKDENISKKISYWNQCTNGDFTNLNPTTSCQNASKHELPPNILIVGIDSTSRINFRRFLNQTVDFLEKNLTAYEMNGYTKVGENTFPNFIPLMTSYSEEELKTVCYSRYKPQDDCPFLWKNFSSLNYLTAHLEDSPQMNICNYMKLGFVKSPTDIYLRPAMISAYSDDSGRVPYTTNCLGNQRPEEQILNFIVDIAKLAEIENIPYFITTWLTDLSHEDMNSLQIADELLHSTLKRLHENGLLNNTVLFLMSDHGYRFFDVRATTSGWYEDKLPALWISLPASITNENPVWAMYLHENSRELTSPFDVHETLNDILRYVSGDVKKANNGANKTVNEGRAISLFEPRPPRTCEEANIAQEFCACEAPIAYNENITLILSAGNALVARLNINLPAACCNITLKSITGVGTLNTAKSHTDILDLIVGVRTNPGNFHFEGFLKYNRTDDSFGNLTNVLRMNKIGHTPCLSAEEAWSYQHICFCK